MATKGKRVYLKTLVEEWKKKSERGKDAHVAISGDEGDGKSSLAGYHILKKYFKGDLWNNIVYTKNPKEFYDKYSELERGGCLVLDEAIELISRVDWNKIETKKLVKKFAADVRKEKNAIFIYNIPIFRELHPYWRNHRVRYWIELTPREWFKRGYNGAIVLERQRIPFLSGKKDTWLLDEEERRWIKAMKTKGALRGLSYFKLLRKNPFYRGEFIFKEPPLRFYKQYHKYRIEAKEIYEKESEIEKTPKQLQYWKARIGKLIYLLRNGLPVKQDGKIITVKFTLKEIMRMIEVKNNTSVSNLIKFYQQAVKAGILEGEENNKRIEIENKEHGDKTDSEVSVSG